MKFPTVTKLLATILAVVSVVLCFTGIYCLNDTLEDKDSNLRKLELLKERTDTYIEYSAKLKDEPTYAEAKETYEKHLAEYEKEAGDHKIDLATYTATKGGIKEGREALDKTPAQLIAATEQINQQEALYNNHSSVEYQSAINTARTTALEKAKDVKIDQVGMTLSELEAALNTAKSGLAQAEEGKKQAESAYNTYVGLIASKEQLDATILYLNSIPSQAELDAKKAEIDELKAKQDELTENELSIISQYEANVAARNGEPSIEEQLESANLNLELTKSGLEQFQEYDKESLKKAVDTADGYVNTASAAVTQLEMAYNGVVNGIYTAADQAVEQTLKQTIAEARAKIQVGWDTLSLSEIELKKLEKELPDTFKELQEEKEKIDGIIKEIEEEYEYTEQLKVDEKKLTSTTLLLNGNENIKRDTEAGMNLEDAAKSEISRLETYNELEYKLRLISNSGLIIAFICAIFVALASFGKIKSRFMQIFLICLIIALCGFAQWVSVYLGRGDMYSCIVTGAIALITLIFMIPTKKKEIGSN